MAASPGSGPISPPSCAAPSTDAMSPAAPATPPRRTLYGRRQGPKLRAAAVTLLDSVLPDVAFTVTPGTPLDPRALFADPPRALRLEIGFGGGEHLAAQAATHPEIGFLGVEPFLNGVAKLLALIEAKKIGNITVHAGDVRELFELLPDGVLDCIYVLYPDPWPKARHLRRRMISQDNLRQFHRLLKPGGLLLFASDIEHYVQWTLFETRQAGGFTWTAECPKDWREPFPDWIMTRYEAKAKREGRVSSYLTFRRD